MVSEPCKICMCAKCRGQAWSTQRGCYERWRSALRAELGVGRPPARRGALPLVGDGHHGLVADALRRRYRCGQQFLDPAGDAGEAGGGHVDADELAGFDVPDRAFRNQDADLPGARGAQRDHRQVRTGVRSVRGIAGLRSLGEQGEQWTLRSRRARRRIVPDAIAVRGLARLAVDGYHGPGGGSDDPGNRRLGPVNGQLPLVPGKLGARGVGGRRGAAGECGGKLALVGRDRRPGGREDRGRRGSDLGCEELSLADPLADGRGNGRELTGSGEVQVDDSAVRHRSGERAAVGGGNPWHVPHRTEDARAGDQRRRDPLRTGDVPARSVRAAPSLAGAPVRGVAVQPKRCVVGRRLVVGLHRGRIQLSPLSTINYSFMATPASRERPRQPCPGTPATAGYVHEPGNSGYRWQAHDYARSVIPRLPGQCPFYTTDSRSKVMILETAIRFI